MFLRSYLIDHCVAGQPLKTAENLGLVQVDQVFGLHGDGGGVDCPWSRVEAKVPSAELVLLLQLGVSEEFSVNPAFA